MPGKLPVKVHPATTHNQYPAKSQQGSYLAVAGQSFATRIFQNT